MFRRILNSIGIGAEPLDAEAFTRRALEVFRKEGPSFRIEEEAPLHLKVTGADNSPQEVYLDNLYRGYLANPKSSDAEIARFARVMLDGGGATELIIPKNIIPVVRDHTMVGELEGFLAKNKKADEAKVEVAFEPLGADLVIIYVADNPQTIQYLTREHVADVHLAGKTLRELAIENLREILSEIKSEGANGFFFFSAGGMYEPSLLLIDSIWEKFRAQIPPKGELVFAIPSRDALFVADSGIPEAIAHLAKITPEIFRDAPYRVSDKLYVRHPDRITFYAPDQRNFAGR